MIILRWLWLTLLGILAFVGIAILSRLYLTSFLLGG
jgi:hypothetical protein